MGRPRKPLEMQRGNLTVISMARRKNEEKKVKTGSNQLSRPPDWLIDEVAVKEWKRIVKELKKINLIGNLDRNNLGGYCNAFANYVKSTNILRDQAFYIDRETRNGVIVVKNPMVDIQKGYAEEMRRFASLCGLTIAAAFNLASIVSPHSEANLLISSA